MSTNARNYGETGKLSDEAAVLARRVRELEQNLHTERRLTELAIRRSERLESRIRELEGQRLPFGHTRASVHS